VRLQQERDQLSQERARALEGERRVDEELNNRNQELTGKIFFVLSDHKVCIAISWCLLSSLAFLENFVIVLKADTKKHLEELVKERDS